MIKRATLVALFSFGLVFTVSAQNTFQNSFLNSYDQATDKVMQLADAFSEDQYSWRPAEGVRSVSEAMMHVASANFFFASMLGSEVPDGTYFYIIEAKGTDGKEYFKKGGFSLIR